MTSNERFYGQAVKAFTHSPLSVSGGRESSDRNGANWGNPEPVVAASEETPYPVASLPDLIRAAVAEVAGFSQAPLALVGCSALSALSLAGQGLVTVRRAEGLEGPASLYLMVLAESGERKSAVDERFTLPIRGYESDMAERAKPDWAEYRASVRAWEAKLRGVESRVTANMKAAKPTAADEQVLQRLEAAKPPPPRFPRLLYTDATPEALTIGLAERWPSAGVMSAEAGAVFGGHGMGRDSVMRSLALLNSAWDGRLAPSDRVSRESTGPRTVRLTCGLAAQPEAVRVFLEQSRGLARGTGFLARFLLARPASTQGTRRFKDAPTGWPALSAFHQRLRALLEIPVRFDDGDLSPGMLEFSPVARKRWIAFHDDVEGELRTTGMLANARDFAAKAADNAARMAGLFHLYAHGPGGEIGLESVEAAASLVTWHTLEALRFTDEIVIPRQTANALTLDAWLVARYREDQVGAIGRSQVLRLGPGVVREKAMLDEALGVLMQANRVRLAKEGRTTLIQVNPALIGGA